MAVVGILGSTLLVTLLLFLGLCFAGIGIFLFKTLPFLQFIIEAFYFEVEELLFDGFLLIGSKTSDLKCTLEMHKGELLHRFVIGLFGT